MSARFRSGVGALLLAVSATLLGGCPEFALVDTIPSGQQGAAEQAAAAAPSASAGALDSEFSAGLRRDFPACQTPARLIEWRDEIIRLVNATRRSQGLQELRPNETLERQATQYACEMIQYDFFDHVNPVTGSTLGDRAREFGYDFTVVGENLAAGQRSPQQAFNDWMNSPSHRDNILEPRFSEIGVGIRIGGTYGVYWVQEFGHPRRVLNP